jgi:hypothetical protein
VSFFRLLRIVILLTILAIVAGSQWLTRERVTDWRDPIWMTIYPVVADAHPETLAHVRGLGAGAFSEVGDFLALQARRYGRDIDVPLIIQLAPAGKVLPPDVPAAGNRLAIAVWSLKMRWWTWQRGRGDGLPDADVQMFVLYRRAGAQASLEPSVGMQKGMYGIVNAQAARNSEPRNRLILAHELLHVLGATDKYDYQTGQPFAPTGLAEPGRSPMYPQKMAEIMGGRIAVSAVRSVEPRSLRACVIGPGTAAEIGLLDS